MNKETHGKARHGGRDALFLEAKMQHGSRRGLSLVKNAALAFIISFLVISIDDEYGEEDDDDYETKDMGLHDMDAINELINSCNQLCQACCIREAKPKNRTDG